MKRLEWRIVDDTDLVSDCIRFISRGTVCHVEFLTSDGNTIGARSNGGVKIRPIDTFKTDLRFYCDCPDEQYDKAWSFLTAQIGKPYDYTDIVAIMANRDWHDPSRWICSELWVATLEAGGLIQTLHESINRFTPEDSLILSSAIFRSDS
jgi:uncharacterized protein YycO